MEKIVILSPHRDDSSFSLGLTLSLCGLAAVKLQVLNFFTQSAYAPYSSASTVEEISAVRAEEDHKALDFINSGIEVASLGLLDAPLRLSLPFSQITQEQSADRISQEELCRLSQHIQEHCNSALAIAPLGLGNHVDHIAVHRAALNALPPQDIAFYEDVPYATWTSAADLQDRIRFVEGTTGIRLEPFITQIQDAVQQKRRIVSFYQSQITAEEADAMARYAEACCSGERLWLPADSKKWEAIQLLATGSPQTATPYLPK